MVTGRDSKSTESERCGIGNASARCSQLSPNVNRVQQRQTGRATVRSLDDSKPNLQRDVRATTGSVRRLVSRSSRWRSCSASAIRRKCSQAADVVTQVAHRGRLRFETLSARRSASPKEPISDACSSCFSNSESGILGPSLAICARRREPASISACKSLEVCFGRGGQRPKGH